MGWSHFSQLTRRMRIPCGGSGGARLGPHSNPNDAITLALGGTVPNQCHLDYFHKDAPTPEPDNFTECHRDANVLPRRDRDHATKLKEGYGPDTVGSLRPPIAGV